MRVSKVSSKVSFLIAVLVSAPLMASTGLSTSARFLTELNTAFDFKQFILKVAPHTLPGDKAYLQTMLQNHPDLAEAPAKPKVIFEKGTWTVRVDQSSVNFKILNLAKGEWQVNGKSVTLNPWSLAPERWKALAAAIQDRKTAHFALLPVAWAEENGEPTETLMTVFSATSSIAREGSVAGAITLGKGSVDQLLQKAGNEGVCNRKVISETAQIIGVLSPDEINCSEKNNFMAVKFKSAGAIRFVRFSKVGEKTIVSDEELLNAKPTVSCQFDLSNWESEKCSADQARIEQLKDWASKESVQNFCLKCRPLIASLAAKSVKRPGTK